MSPRWLRSRRKSRMPYTAVKRGVKPGLKQLPLSAHEALYGRVNEYQRVEGGTVEFVIEGNGHADFCAYWRPVRATTPSDFGQIRRDTQLPTCDLRPDGLGSSAQECLGPIAILGRPACSFGLRSVSAQSIERRAGATRSCARAPR